MKIGIMGGTFDPVHLAHLEMGRAAKEQKKLEQVWFMPSKNPPHKRKITEESMRYRWVELAVREKEGFLVSDFELKFSGVSYTAEMLKRLEREYPENQFFFILGGDSLFAFEHWYHPEVILAHAEILCFSRDGVSREKMDEQAEFLMKRFGGKIEVLKMQEMAISSSMIREKIAKGESVKEYLPKELWQMIPEMEKVFCAEKQYVDRSSKGEKI